MFKSKLICSWKCFLEDLNEKENKQNKLILYKFKEFL